MYWASSSSTGITNVVWQRAGNTTERPLCLTVVQHRAVLCPHTLLNMLVDAVVRKWLADVMDDIESAIEGLQGDDASRMASLFYADDGAIGSLDHEWLQHANQHLCNLFRDCTGLVPNTEKTETMSCHPGTIRGRCSNEGYKRRHEGTGDTYVKRKGKRTVCPVPSCGKDLALGSLQSHLRTQHGMDSSGSIITEPVELAPFVQAQLYPSVRPLKT